jgi:hypothetical protein
MSDQGTPDMNKFRYQIDTLTPGIPEGLTREEIVTFVLASQMQGMAIGLQSVLEQDLLGHPEAIRISTEKLQRLSDELVDVIPDVNL